MGAQPLADDKTVDAGENGMDVNPKGMKIHK